MFPVMKLFDKYKVPYRFVHTCQHYDIIEENRKLFKIKKPDVYLTMKKKDLGNIWQVIMWAPHVLFNGLKLPIKKDDWVLIHGDTESTLLALLIAKFFRAKTAHIEAGGRSGKWLEPFPEEIIRTITDMFCDLDFCPYTHDAANIKRDAGKIITNGNTVFDSIRWALKTTPSAKVKRLMKHKYVLFLIHRKENVLVKDRLNAIIDILEQILKRGFKVVWPMHTNTKYELQNSGMWDKIVKYKSKYDLEIDYFFNYADFMHASKHSQFVASDGGGLQKETYFMNKPMLVLRTVIEEEPGVGETSYLSYLDKDKVEYFLDNYTRLRSGTHPTGSPSKLIVEYFIKHL